MDSNRLAKLLAEIDARLARVAKSLGSPGDPVLGRLADVRNEARRQLSKVDQLRSSDVDRLENLVGRLREVAHSDLPSSFAVSAVRSISEDQIGIMNLLHGLRIGLSLLGPGDVLDLVPGQKTAAFTFGFDGDFLAVVDQPFRPHELEADIAITALEEAIEQGEYVSEELEKSNVSSRLRFGFVRLQAALASRNNIVQAGSRLQMCNRQVAAESDELSASLAALLVGHLETVSRALLQFQEWREYCERSLTLNVDPPSLAALAQSARAMADDLRKTGAVAESVSDAFGTVSGWVEENPVPDKRDVLSLIRVIENIWSITTRSLISLGKETVSEARKLAAKAVLGALLLGAGAAAIPIIGKIPGAEWVQTAYTYFKAIESPKAP